MAEQSANQIPSPLPVDSASRRLILPRFWHKSFLFEDGEMPEHVDEYPYFARFPGMHEVLGAKQSGDTYRVAVDVEQLATALLLAKARERHQLQSIGLYGYAEPVLIRYPDNTLIVHAEGKNI